MLVNKPHQRHVKQPVDFLIKKLNLNEEQELKFLILDKEHSTKMMFYDAEIMELKKNMFNSFSGSDKVDNAITLKIGELVAKKETEIFYFFKRVRNICNKEQFIFLEEIIKRAIMHSGGMPKDHGNMAPRPPRDGERFHPRQQNNGDMPPPPPR